MTWNMMLGARVLILTQVLVVGVAAVWYVRSQRKRGAAADAPFDHSHHPAESPDLE